MVLSSDAFVRGGLSVLFLFYRLHIDRFLGATIFLVLHTISRYRSTVVLDFGVSLALQ